MRGSVRVYPTGGKVNIAQARGPGGPKRVTVGRHGVLGAEQARQRAALIIARVKAGEEPAPEPMKPAGGPTVGELAGGGLKRSTQRSWRRPHMVSSSRAFVEGGGGGHEAVVGGCSWLSRGGRGSAR